MSCLGTAADTPESTPVKKLKITRCGSCLVARAGPNGHDCVPCAAKGVLHDIAARRLLPEKQCVFVDTASDCRTILLEDLERTLGGRHFTQLSTTDDVSRHFDVFLRRTADDRWDNSPNALGQYLMERLGFATEGAVCGDICITGPGRTGLFPSEVKRILAMAEEFASKE
jgi:hypothetical protein